LAVIGAGKIGSAILKAVKDDFSAIGTGRSDETLRRVREIGAVALRDNEKACRMADVVLICVKPFQLPNILHLRNCLADKAVISVMAGVKTELLESVFPGARVVRAMPNINILVNSSVTALAAGKSAEKRDMEIAEEIFRKLGSVMWISEEYMDPFTALVGSGPAFIAEIIDALVLGAVSAGMPRDMAYMALLKLIEGTIKNLETGVHPIQLRDLVTTPAGTTIAGMSRIIKVKEDVVRAVRDASRRAEELGAEVSSRVEQSLKFSPYKVPKSAVGEVNKLEVASKLDEAQ